MFFAITGAIYLGGAGAVIIGGLYWKKGTAAAAWTAMTVGSSLAVGGILVGQFWKPLRAALLELLPNAQWLLQNPDKFPINGQVLFFWSMIAAILLYVAVSLLTCREDFDMDAMLHRGRHAAAPQPGDAPALVAPVGFKAKMLGIIGIDSNFTFGDKVLSISVFSWGMFWFFVFLIVTAWNLLVSRWSGQLWSDYYHVTGVLIPFGIAVVTCVWFTWGGIRDLRRMFASLRTVRRNAHDDGTVVGHRNLDEAEADATKH
jgi:SSS family solute:Na+ symporter